ncbi:hypothetical protein D9M68_589100 [compost metagenome]
MAGSIPIRFKIKGIPEPVTPAITRLPVIARKITKPNIGLASKKNAKIKITKPVMAPLIKPTVNSFKTVR